MKFKVIVELDLPDTASMDDGEAYVRDAVRGYVGCYHPNHPMSGLDPKSVETFRLGMRETGVTFTKPYAVLECGCMSDVEHREDCAFRRRNVAGNVIKQELIDTRIEALNDLIADLRQENQILRTKSLSISLIRGKMVQPFPSSMREVLVRWDLALAVMNQLQLLEIPEIVGPFYVEVTCR